MKKNVKKIDLKDEKECKKNDFNWVKVSSIEINYFGSPLKFWWLGEVPPLGRPRIGLPPAAQYNAGGQETRPRGALSQDNESWSSGNSHVIIANLASGTLLFVQFVPGAWAFA